MQLQTLQKKNQIAKKKLPADRVFDYAVADVAVESALYGYTYTCIQLVLHIVLLYTQHVLNTNYKCTQQIFRTKLHIDAQFYIDIYS